MKEQLITFETARLAKDKGFDIPTRNFYADFTWKSIEIYSCNEVGYGEFTDSMENEHGFGDIVLIPTQSLLQKWLREVHKIDVFVVACYIGEKKHRYSYYITNPLDTDADGSESLTYEEALEIGLQEGLKLI
jgi:hypothetical protein